MTATQAFFKQDNASSEASADVANQKDFKQPSYFFQEAMRTILSQLKEEDEFSLVWFSSEAEAWSDELLPADEDNIEEALEFIDRGEAMGGTNIHSALLKGLEVRHSITVHW